MAILVRNAIFDPATGDIHVDAEGIAPAWINVDSLMAQYHGAGRMTKDSIWEAIAKWLKDRRNEVIAVNRENKQTEDAVSSLKGMRLVA